MKKIIINEHEYELIENYKECFNKEELLAKVTDYFDDYDYILGDYAYGKLRLKGFCDENNEKCNEINYIKIKDSYIENECAYGCAYFLIKKTK